MKWLSFVVKRLHCLILSRIICKLSSKPILSISSFCSWYSTYWYSSPSRCSSSAGSRQKSQSPFRNWPNRSRTPRTSVKMLALTIKTSNSSRKTRFRNKDRKSIGTMRKPQLQSVRWISKDHVLSHLSLWKEILRLWREWILIDPNLRIKWL